MPAARTASPCRAGGDVLYISNSNITIASNSYVFVIGSGNTISAGSNNMIGVDGSNNKITGASYCQLSIYGTCDTVSASNSSIDFIGESTGNTVSGSGNAIRYWESGYESLADSGSVMASAGGDVLDMESLCGPGQTGITVSESTSQLIQAMAAFDAQAAGQTYGPTAAQLFLEPPLLAASH